MLVSIALPLPLFRTFSYEVDDVEAERAQPGMRAVVPFHGRRVIGVIVGAAESQASITPKRVHALPDPEPVVSASLLALSQWMAEYYVVPLGVTLRCVLPAALGSHQT